MTKNVNKWKVGVILTLLLVFAFLIGFRTGKTKEASATVVVRQIDTIKVTTQDSIYIPKTKVRTVYSVEIDTVIITRAFEKSIDTTIDKARLQVSYYFPQDSFKIMLWNYIKEIKTNDTIKVNYPIETLKTKDAIKWGVAGAVAGAVIGFVIAK